MHDLHFVLLTIQHTTSFIGVLIILSGVIWSLYCFFYYALTKQLGGEDKKINLIRLNLGRVLILGLEFIVAADLIGTTTAPDYYSVGILAIIVIIRTVLSFSLNKELMGLKES